MGQKHECFVRLEEYRLNERYLHLEQAECISPQVRPLELEFHFVFLAP